MLEPASGSLEPSSDPSKPAQQEHPQHGARDQADQRSNALKATAADFVPGRGEGGGGRTAGGDVTQQGGRGGHGGRGRRGRGGRIGPHPGPPGRDAGSHGSYSHPASSSGGGRGRRQLPDGLSAPPQQPAAEGGQAAAASPQAGGGYGGSYGRSPPGRTFVRADFLLNFQSAGRQGGSHRGGRGGPPRPGARRGPRPQAYDRNKFLQANFRFLVSDAMDVRRFESDADLMLEWEDVVQVEMLSHAPIDCPISLYAPLCPQITPCGHVFSFPAIMQHLVNHGGPELRKSAPCPLCFTQISARELRLVRVIQVTPIRAGSEAQWCLLRRPRGGIIPNPVEPAAAASPGGSPQAGTRGPKPASPGSRAPHAEGVGGSAGKAPWPRSAASTAAQPSGHAAAGDDGGAAAGSSLRCSPFAKFTTVADPTPLWLAAAEQLAQYAIQVTSEGGLDAAYEAPNVYAAMDALAARARSWAERRQRALLGEGQPGSGGVGHSAGGGQLASAEEAGRLAEAVVRQATTAAVSAEAEARDRRAQEAARERLFPSLAVAAAAATTPAPAAGRGAAAGSGRAGAPAPAGPAGPHTPHDSAWGEESEEEEEREGPGPRVGGRTGSRAGPASAPVPVPARPDAANQAEGTAAELSSSARSGGPPLGSSPADASAPGAPPGGDYYFYQSADGQWAFLHPLNARMLLQHYGAYPACPPALSAKVLEVEDVAQDEASRRRLRVLSHLPLTGAFKLCEVDLSQHLPPEALAPFVEELAQRERRRAQRAKQEARRAAKEAAAAAAAVATANRGLSEAELRAMPLPSASRLPEALAEGVDWEADAALGESPSAAAAPVAPPQQGVSFARITRMGFAATGPSLGIGGDSAGSPGSPSGPGLPAGPPASVPAGGAAAEPAGPALRGAWGAKAAAGTGSAGVGGGASSSASTAMGGLGRAFAELGVRPGAGQQQQQQQGQQGAAGAGKGKGKKGKQMLLLSTAQRRY